MENTNIIATLKCRETERRKRTARMELLPEWLHKLYTDDPIVHVYVEHYVIGNITFEQMQNELIQTLVKAKNEAYENLHKHMLTCVRPLIITTPIEGIKNDRG